MGDYLKTNNIFDYLVATSELVLEIGLVLYILNFLGPKYLTFITTFNMTQLRPSMRILHNQLESF